MSTITGSTGTSSALQSLNSTAATRQASAAGGGKNKVIKETAAQLVSTLFFQPLLAEMRKLPFGKDIGSGGRGEEVFGEQLDSRAADAVSAASPNSLTQQIEDELSGVAGKDHRLARVAGRLALLLARQALWPQQMASQSATGAEATTAAGDSGAATTTPTVIPTATN